MSALKPIENARVLGVAAETYPLNRVCAHPDCREAVDDPHHCFARSRQIGGSYFVEITFDSEEQAAELAKLLGTKANGPAVIIPHVAGLCRAHHDAVEEHESWIILDLTSGRWAWYDRCDADDGDIVTRVDGSDVGWSLAGDLNPQPGSVEGKPKKRRFKGEARKKRKVLSVRVPDTADENGAELFDEAIEALETKLVGPDGDHRPIYYTIMAALDWCILNADATDFTD